MASHKHKQVALQRGIKVRREWEAGVSTWHDYRDMVPQHKYIKCKVTPFHRM